MMAYTITENGEIKVAFGNTPIIILPAENNDTPEWRAYQEWLDAGNIPDIEPLAEPEPDYISFWNSLLESSVYQSIREQSFNSLIMNTLATEFIALIGDAKSGMANEVAIQSSMNAILETGTFTQEHISELQNSLISGNLNNIYNLNL